ncbi:IS110 family transposase [Metallumcola ferriviriculae]|uniref:IS110 family transposase n=1 Tax=Metallumcola ferriviriculae TaxID=3039180 RepID=A0AAU0UKA7_9FIRM|nr:IS110 family transposase [Desulfitibacteraceae bacterium MK1]WRO21627.1 IS110 family transposase [Desulfitibacteraceae bacterium MK1]WRO22298.1 IS110 family transposase [Desulfitibacteraceae bacterium MK1]
MKYNQNFKISQVTENTLVIGVDIAKSKHYARAFDWRGIELSKVISFRADRRGFRQFREWAEKIARDEGKNKIIVGMEPTGHYWFTFAADADSNQMMVVQVNPYHVKQSKEMDDNTPSKNDRKDPRTIAMLVKDGRYLIPYFPKGHYAEMRKAYEIRENQLQKKWAIKNRVQRWLDIYFPEFTQVFKSWEGKAALMTLEKFPTPTEIVELGAEKILAAWREKVKRAVGIKKAEALVKMAEETVGIQAGLEMAKYELECMLQEYQAIRNMLEMTEQKLETLASLIPGMDKVLQIKGVGVITAAGFIAEAGDLSRFNHPKQIIKLAGLNVRENSSGKHKGQSTISKRGRKRLRSLLFRAILPLVAKNKEFKEIHKYYTTRPVNPLRKKQSLIVLCGKLIRVIYALLTQGVEYSPEKLLSDIKRPKVMTQAA